MNPIYLDNNATTALDPRVLETMRPHFLNAGNAESRHSAGRAARRAWDSARDSVAAILGAKPSEVIFTSGGTEANNLAVFGLAGDIFGAFSTGGQNRPTSSLMIRIRLAGYKIGLPKTPRKALFS